MARNHDGHDLAVMMEALLEYQVTDGTIDTSTYDLVAEEDMDFFTYGRVYCNTCDDYLGEAHINRNWSISLPENKEN